MSKPVPVFEVKVTPENFEAEVIGASEEALVLLDFWAEWCGPCRQLTPVLEALVREHAGDLRLAKVNVDEEPALTAQFGVRTIPTVLLVRGRKVVDSFQGAMPAEELRRLLGAYLPTETDRVVRRGRELEASDMAAAGRCYGEALAKQPDHVGGLTGALRVALHEGKLDEARGYLAKLEHRGYLEPEAEALKGELRLRELGGAAGSLESARAAAEAAPGDYSAQLRYAEALAAAGQYEPALERFLDLVERDRTRTGETARQAMVAIFAALPADSPLLAEYQRRLSVAL